MRHFQSVSLCLMLSVIIAQTYATHTYDGRHNNFKNHRWGSAQAPLVRVSYPAFTDGSYSLAGQDRPPNRLLSNTLLDGPSGLPNEDGKSALFLFFGQAVVAEIVETARNQGCPREFINVAIPKCDPTYDPTCELGPLEMPVRRVEFLKRTGQGPNIPRQPLNKVTSFIDGTIIYGISKLQADTLRTFVDGKMLMGEFDLMPLNKPGIPMDNIPPPSKQIKGHPHVPLTYDIYMAGNLAANENPMLATIQILFLREHNRQCELLKQKHPDWNDEQLFARARAIVIALQQHITMHEWLVNWFRTRLPPYTGYKAEVDPSFSVEANLAMRFGHSMVPAGFVRRDLSDLSSCKYLETHRLCNTLFNARSLLELDKGIEPLLFGSIIQTVEKEDHIMTEDLRSFVYGELEFSRRDLAALNIQRTREFGIPDFNSVRRALGLPAYTNFTDVAGEAGLAKKLSDVYNGDINNIDFFVGMFLEDPHKPELSVARAIFTDQFSRIRDGDRWWYANEENGLFTRAEIAEIEATRFSDIVRRNLRQGDASLIPDDVFHVYNSGCPAITVNKKDLPACTKLVIYDYLDASPGHLPILIFSYVGYTLLLILGLTLCYRAKQKRFFSNLMKYHTLANNPKLEEVVEFDKLDYSGSSSGSKSQSKSGSGSPPVTLDLSGSQGSSSSASSIAESYENAIGNTYTAFTTDMSPEHLCLVKISSDSVIITQKYTKTRTVLLSRLGSITHNASYTTVALRCPNRYDVLLLSPKESLASLVNDIKESYRSATNEDLTVEQTWRPARGLTLLEDKIKTLRPVVQDLLSEENVGHKVDSRIVEAFLEGLVLESHDKYLDIRAFAHIFHLPPDAPLAKHIFELANKSGTGKVSAQEFGSFMEMYRPENDSLQSAPDAFAMFDVDKKGALTHEEFSRMLLWQARLNGVQLEIHQARVVAGRILRQAKVDDPEKITFEEFEAFTQGPARSVVDLDDGSKWLQFRQHGAQPSKPLRHHMLHRFWLMMNYEASFVFCLVAYFMICIALFLERFYTYLVEKQTGDLTRISGWGICFTRGTASVMSFSFPMCLLTMTKGLWALVARSRHLARVLPVHNMTKLHSVIAWTACIMAFIHTGGHMYNFYEVGRAPVEDLQCTFREVYRKSHELPSILGFWIFGTMTGFSGYLLLLVVIAFMITSLHWFRRRYHAMFWYFHHLAFVLAILLLVHGVARIVQTPVGYIYYLSCVGPFIFFRILRLRYSTQSLRVSSASIVDGILRLRFEVPSGFNYRGGQYMLVNVPAVSRHSVHPLSFTSSSSEPFCEFHCRAVGEWTYELLRVFREAGNNSKVPRVRIDGPFGWVPRFAKGYDAVALFGSGVGVAPIIAILKDLFLAHEVDKLIQAKSTKEKKHKKLLSKVYLFWVARTQDELRWFSSALKEIVEHDLSNLIEINVFLTSNELQRADLALLLLQWAEDKLLLEGQLSFMSGLPARTHFGRPHWGEVFKALSSKHPSSKIGVYTVTNVAIADAVDHEAVSAGSDTATEFVVTHETAFH